MAKRGPKPKKPQLVKVIAGVPVCPDWLDPVAKAKWTAIVPELAKSGLVTVLDGDGLAAYCQAFAELRASTEALQRDGRVQSTSTGYLAPHPAVAMQQKAMGVMLSFASRFGLSPVDRKNLPAVAPDAERDELGEFIGNGKP